MSAIPTHDNAPANTGWFAVSVDNTTSANTAIALTEHMTLGVDDLGKQALTSSAASHACHVRSDRGMLRIEPLRGDVRIDGRVIGARALLSRSSVLRLGQHAFFISDSLLVEEPVELISELPGYWQPFMEELEAIPEPTTRSHAPEPAPQPGRRARTERKQSSDRPDAIQARQPGEQRRANRMPVAPKHVSRERARDSERRRMPPRREGRTWLLIAITALTAVVVLTATAIVADPAGTPAQLWRSLLALLA